jgi:hypothetical protein
LIIKVPLALCSFVRIGNVVKCVSDFIQSGSLHCSLLRMTKSIHVLQDTMVRKLGTGRTMREAVEEDDKNIKKYINAIPFQPLAQKDIPSLVINARKLKP